MEGGGNGEGKRERTWRSGRRSDIVCQIRFSHLPIKDLTAQAHSSLSLSDPTEAVDVSTCVFVCMCVRDIDIYICTERK